MKDRDRINLLKVSVQGPITLVPIRGDRTYELNPFTSGLDTVSDLLGPRSIHIHNRDGIMKSGDFLTASMQRSTGSIRTIGSIPRSLQDST
jgi:hypothetical protein